MRERWEYESLPVAFVVGLLEARSAVKEMGEGYVSEDHELRRYDDLMKRGFRWVRTELGHAIFERKVQK
jgi:hypothetical protein